MDAYDGDQTTAAGYGMVDIALSARTRLNGGARVERFDQTVNTFDPFGLFVRTISATNKNTDVFPGNQPGAGVRQPEPPPELQLDGQSSGIPRAGGVRIHRRRRQPRHPWQPRAEARADPERGCALGDCSRAAAASSPPAYSSSASISRSSASSLPARSRSSRSRTPTRRATSVSSSRRRTTSAAACSSTPTTPSSIRRSRCCPSNRRSRPRSSGRWPASRRTCSTSPPSTRCAASRRACCVNYAGDRISDVGSNQAPDIIEEGRGTRGLRVHAARSARFNVRLSGENLTDTEYLFTQGAARPARLQARPDLRRVVRRQRVLGACFKERMRTS